MEKDNMLRWLSYEFDSWNEVYNKMVNPSLPTLSGWWACFDGPSVGEVYLTNEHPLGDLSGDIITINDFNEVKT